MFKLSGHSLTKADWFLPETMGLNITERSSTAQITRGFDSPDLQVGDWVLDDCEPGAGIVWRVKIADDNFSSLTRTCTLEHIINSLRDISMFGEVKPADITGSASATTCTARQAAEYVLSKQSIWTLGDFEYTDSAPFSFNGDDLFSAMEKITSALDDPWWEYDLTSLPFTLHIRHKSTTPDCEMRMGRNITTLRRTIDRTNMYTRIYPIGKKNLHITGEYITKNESTWGRKDKVETDQSQETEQMLRLWATDRLNRHCDPTITFTIAGLDLSRDTGEALDTLVIGRLCRVPLPDFGITVNERITKLAWRDKMKEPDNFTVTLCNNRQDIASIITQQAAGGGSGARAEAKEAEEDHAWFVDTSSHVAMVAEAIIGRDGETVDWSRVAEIIVDGSGIHQLVVASHESIVTAFGRIDMNDESLTSIFQKTGVDSLASGDTLYSKITQTADSLSSEITRATEAEGSLSSRVTQTASSLTAEITRATAAEGSLGSRITQTAESLTAEITRATEAEGSLSSRVTQTASSLTAEITRATTAEGSLSSRITLTAESLALKVSAGSVATQLAIEMGNVSIVGGNLEVDGYVKANEIDADFINARFASNETLSVTNLEVTYLDASHIIINEGSQLESVIDSIGPATASGGQITIPYTTLNGGSGSVNFNIADTQFYIDGVAAAAAGVTLSGAWSGTVAAGKAYAVTASNGATKTSPKVAYIGTDGSATWASDNKSFSQKLVVLDENDADLYERTMTFNTTTSYNAGAAAGAAGVTLSGAWSGTASSGKAYVVTASNGATATSPAVCDLLKSGNPTWASDKKSFTQSIYARDANDTNLYVESLSFDTTTSFNEGYSKADAASLALGEWSSGYVWNATVTRADGTTSAKTINCQVPYQSGYSAGMTAGAAGVTLSGAWSGTASSGKAYVVTASNGETATSPAVCDLLKSGNPTWASDKKSFTQSIYARDANDTNLYIESLSFDTTTSYNEGYSKADVASVNVDGAWSSGWNWNGTATRTDSTTKSVLVNCQTVYQAADAASILAGSYVSNSEWLWNVTVTRADGTTKAMTAQCQVPWQNGYWNATPVSGTASTYVSGTWNWNATITGQGTGVSFSNVPINCQVPYESGYKNGWNDAIDAAVVYTLQRTWYGKLYSSRGTEVGSGSWYLIEGEYGTIYPTTLPAKKT